MNYWNSLISQLPPWAAQVAEIVAIVVGAWIVRVLLLGALRRWADRTSVTWDNAVVDIMDRALKPLLVLTVLASSLNLFDLPPKLMRVSNRVLQVAVIIVALYYVSKIIQVLLDAWLARKSERMAVRDPLQFVTQVLFAGLALMIVLDNLGISLTAVWTTLGVGSVAVALALQDTLSNFFAGVYLRLDSPVRVGDYIKLQSGEDGFVDHMGWRSTRVRQLGNNIVVIPNSKLATTIVTNYNMPQERMSLLINVGVSYDDDPEVVERILIEEAKEAAKTTPGLLSEPEPFVRFIPGFGDSSLDFTLICQVKTYVDQYLAQHEIRKRIVRRFRQEGITIPFPQRDVHLYEERLSARPVPTEMPERAKAAAGGNGGSD